MTEKKYQVKLKIEIATPLHVNAENAQDAIDKAHELFCAMDDLELLDAVQGGQYIYEAWLDTRKKLTDKEIEQMREGQEGKE